MSIGRFGIALTALLISTCATQVGPRVEVTRTPDTVDVQAESIIQDRPTYSETTAAPAVESDIGIVGYDRTSQGTRVCEAAREAHTFPWEFSELIFQSFGGRILDQAMYIAYLAEDGEPEIKEPAVALAGYAMAKDADAYFKTYARLLRVCMDLGYLGS